MPGKTQTYYNENPDKAADKLKYDTDYQKSGYGRMSNILRKRARRKMEKKGLVSLNDKKDVDHKNPLKNGGGNGSGNLAVMSPSKNRANDRPTKNKSKATAKILTT